MQAELEAAGLINPANESHGRTRSPETRRTPLSPIGARQNQVLPQGASWPEPNTFEQKLAGISICSRT